MTAVRGLFAAGILALSVTPSAVEQRTSTPAFEVATIRASTPGMRPSQRVLPSRIDFTSTSLQTLLLTAFRLDVHQVSTPDWLPSVRFDIQATYPAGVTQVQVPEMLQALLRERFGLVTHTEPRRMDAFELLVGKDGIKMREVDPVDELNRDFTPSGQRSRSDVVRDTPDGPVRSMVIPGEVGQRFITTRSFYEMRFTLNRTTRIDATRISIPEFVSLLRVNLNRPVIDRTGLTGLYQFKVELDIGQMPLQMVRTDVNGNSLSEPTGVSTFKAVEGLGLKLEERRSPVDVLVVDRIARTPTEN